MNRLLPILIFLAVAAALWGVELPGIKELDNVQVRDFHTAGVALLGSHGEAGEGTAVNWRVYGESAQLRGKEYTIEGFRMDVEVPGQGNYAISTAAAIFDVEHLEVHGEAPVEFSGEGMRVAGLGIDLFTDAAEDESSPRHLTIVVREAVQLEVARAALRQSGSAELAGQMPSMDNSISLMANRLTMQVTPNGQEAHSRGDLGSSWRGETGLATLEGNVRFWMPPADESAKGAGHHWEGWELTGDRMVVFFSPALKDEASSGHRVNWVERVEVNGHLRVETDGGKQRLFGERGVFTTTGNRLTIDGNVLMMNQFRKEMSSGASPWNLFFTNRATIYFATPEEQRLHRAEGGRASVVSRVELPGEVRMTSGDAAYFLVASRGQFSGEEQCVSLLDAVRCELRGRGPAESGEYLLTGKQVDVRLEDTTNGLQGGRIVFPQGFRLIQPSGGSRVKAGWASLELVDEQSRRARVVCTGNVLAELQGRGGQEYELFLSGERMELQLHLEANGLDCLERIDLPERVTVWGKAKGISHRVGGDKGRYESATRTISLEENVSLALSQASAGAMENGLEEVRVLARRAVVRLSEAGKSSDQVGIASIELSEDLVARTADFSVYVSADHAIYQYGLEELELAGKVRAELSPGNGQREWKQAVTLDTSRVKAGVGLQQIVFPEPLVLSSNDQTIRLSGREGLLDVANHRCALGGDVRLAFLSRQVGGRAPTAVGLATQRVLVSLGERPAGQTGTGRSALVVERVDLPEPLELFTADGRQRLKGERGFYSSAANAVELSGDVEARFAGEAFEQFDRQSGAFGWPGQSERRETEEMILNCDRVVARMRNEPLSVSGESEENPGAKALSMLDALEIPGTVSLRTADGSRSVKADQCHYRQEENAITLEGNCDLKYTDERGSHRMLTPKVLFDCESRTIVTGIAPSERPASEEAPPPSEKPGRTTITIPFASHAAGTREPTAAPRGLR